MLSSIGDELDRVQDATMISSREGPGPGSDLVWSRSDHLLEAGGDLLRNFPSSAFHFGSAFDRHPRKRRRIKLRPIEKEELNIQARIGKSKPRSLTKHSDPFHRATLHGDHDLMKLLLRGHAVKEIDKRDGNMATVS